MLKLLLLWRNHSLEMPSIANLKLSSIYSSYWIAAAPLGCLVSYRPLAPRSHERGTGLGIERTLTYLAVIGVGLIPGSERRPRERRVVVGAPEGGT